MNAPTHVAFASACWLGASLLLHAAPQTAIAGALVAAVVAPIPDWDNLGCWSRTAKPKRKAQPVRWALSKLGVQFHGHPVKYRIALVLSWFGPHRQGPTHSVITAAVLGVLLTLPMLALPWWPWWAGLAVAAGLLTHIAADLANEKPVRVFYPFGPLVAGLGIKVGGATEVLVIRTGCTLATLGLAWLTFHH